MPTTTVTTSTSVVLVATSAAPGPHIVLFPNISTIGRLITVRDNDGAASLSNPIVLSTFGGGSFSGFSNQTEINQPYGFVTLNSLVGGSYSLLNTFAFPAGQAAANVSNLTAVNVYISSQLTMPDLATGSTNTIFTSSGQFIFNNNFIGQVTTAQLQSTTNGLGTAGYLSSFDTLSYTPPLWVAVGRTSNGVASTSNISTPTGTIQWSFDTINWSNSIDSPGFSNQGTAVTSGNGVFVAVGNNDGGLGANTGFIQWSVDGSNWNYSFSPNLSTPQTRLGVNYDNGLYHAVGCNVPLGGNSTILLSQDGKSWVPSQGSPFSGGFCKGVAYGRGVWVAAGGQNVIGANGCLLWSSNGSNWNNAVTVAWTGSNVTDVAFDGTKFLATCWSGTNPAGSNICMSTDGRVWTSAGITGANLGNGSNMYVTGNGSLWIATTDSPTAPGSRVIYSLDGGFTWQSNTTFSNSTATFYKPYYNGSFWWLGTNQNNPGQNMYYSGNGINWDNNILSGGYCNGGYPTAFASRLGFSNASILLASTVLGLEQTFSTRQFSASTISTGIITAASMTVSSLFINVTVVSTTFETINTISTQNVNFISAGQINASIGNFQNFNAANISIGQISLTSAYIPNFSANTAYISSARIDSLSTNFLSSGNVWAGAISTASLTTVGPTTLYTKPQQQLWVALGSGGTSIKYSSDGISWTNGTIANDFTTGRSAAWNGQLWVAVGTASISDYTITTSSDGINWSSSAGVPSNRFTVSGNGVAWNGQLWVAVGKGGATIKYSYDGLSWTDATGGFTLEGNGVSWNGRFWIAVGENSPADSNTIKYSVDGINWTNVSSGGFTLIGFGVAWNGLMWVAVGVGGKTIKYSYNGLTWFDISNNEYTSYGYKVAWNGQLWVAVGSGTNKIKYSFDGINWSNAGSGDFTSTGLGIAWNGQFWVSVGDDSTQNNRLKYSLDGINWSNSSGVGFTIAGYDVAYSQTLLPDIKTQDLNIYSQKQPTFLESTNQILTTVSSIALNNTLYTTLNNRVGINTGNPLYTLDVTGDTRVNGDLITLSTFYVGGSLTQNDIRFYGTNGDGVGPGQTSPYTHTVISERLYSSTLTITNSELLLFKGNDGNLANGFDRVRVLATGGFQVDIAPHAALFPIGGPPPAPSISNCLVVAPSGRVGINTENPVYTLDVTGDLRTLSTLYVGGSASQNDIRFYGTNDDGVGLYNHTVISERIYSGFQRAELLLFKGNDNSTDPNAGPDRVRVLATGGFQVDIATNDTTFPVGGSPPTPVFSNCLVVAPSGNVGINTSNPLYRLDVNGELRTLSTLYVGGSLRQNDIRFYGTATDAPGDYFYTVISEREYSTDNSELLLFKANDGPDRVRVLATGGFQVDISPIGVAAVAAFPLGGSPPAPSISNCLVVAPSGNVGINTSNPQTTLHVNGGFRLGGATNSNIYNFQFGFVPFGTPFASVISFPISYSNNNVVVMLTPTNTGVSGGANPQCSIASKNSNGFSADTRNAGVGYNGEYWWIAFGYF
jgi:hypothetical protein